MSDAALPPGPRPGPRDTVFFDDPMVDQLLRAVVTLTMELSVTRDRLDALEQLLAADGTLDPAALATYRRDTAAEAARTAERRRLIADTLGPLVNRLASSA